MTPRTNRIAVAGAALAKALERVHERDRLRARCGEALAALHLRMREVAELRAAWRRENAQAEALARPGIRRLAASIAGDATRPAQEARSRADATKRRLDTAKESADAHQAEIREVRARIDAMGDVDEAAFVALAEKEDAIADASPRAREALRRVALAVGEARERLAAVNEVSESAGRTRRIVRRVRDELAAAGNAASDDVLAEQVALRTAMASARVAETRLARLSRELAGVPELGMKRTPGYRTQGLWMSTSRASADNARIDAWLGRLFDRIQTRRAALKASIAKIEARRDRWVLQVGGRRRPAALPADRGVS